VVYPAAALIPYAKQAGAKVIEINPEETAWSATVDCALRGLAGDLTPRLLESEPSNGQPSVPVP
jgi:NAD-dependent deacetylase